jgi:DNA-binding NtrC family response regulator
MAKPVVLCVDDEAIILMAMQMELRQRLGPGYRYEGALNAQAALEIIDGVVEDGAEGLMIVSDLLLPGLRGDELVREAWKRFPGAKAVIVTGNVDHEALARLRAESPLCAVLPKPWSGEKLARAVREALENECPHP